MTHDSPSPGLVGLNRILQRELQLLNYPVGSWAPERTTDSGDAVSDVVVVGGGMCGLAAAFELRRKGINRVRVFDSQPAGKEGPWVTFARMLTLRSPKDLLGPACGIPSLTFRAWFEAQFGHEAWTALDKIPREMWMDYLIWYREALELSVENQILVKRIEPAERGLLRVVCEGLSGKPVVARKVVIATGRSGQGGPHIPAWASSLPRDTWSHTSDDIDFANLRNRVIAVIGAGASAMDNAAEALEQGAAHVHMIVRRPELPRINKLMGVGSLGFTDGFPALSDAWRWRIMHYSQATQTPPPRASVQRVSQHTNASLHLGVNIRTTSNRDGRVQLLSHKGRVFEVDHVIFGTGFAIDVRQPEGLIAGAEKILLWKDRYLPPVNLADESLAQSPYLDHGFRFTEKNEISGQAPWLRHIHCFNHIASLSLGKVSGDIPRVSEGASWLASAIAESLYTEDIEYHWRTLQNYSTPELRGDEWVGNQ